MKKLAGTGKYRYYVACALLLAAAIRFILILRADFPLNQGGMFYVVVKDILQANFRLPLFTSYNFDTIPLAYSPLPFYIAAVLNKFFHIPLLAIFRFLPMLVSLAIIPVYYKLCVRILSSHAASFFALFAYIITADSFQSLIEGGGLTRSFGVLFAMLAIYTMLSYYTVHKRKFLFFSTVFLALSAISHIETASFAVLSIVAMFIAYEKSVKGFFWSLAVGIGALLLISPWLWIVISHHGFVPYLSAMRSNPLNSFTLSQLWLLGYVGAPKIQILPVLYILGFFVSVARKQYVLPLWFGFLLITVSRMIPTSSSIPLSMMAGLGMQYVFRAGLQSFVAKNKIVTYQICLILVCMFLSFATIFGHGFNQFGYLPKDERVAMDWIKQNTPPTSSFVVISPVPSWLWFLDTTLEWFPALAERKSLTTVQGYEWLPGFSKRLLVNKKLKMCNDEDVTCLQRFSLAEHVQYHYVYVSKHVRLESDLPPCCLLLLQSLSTSPQYQKVYDGPGATVWAKKK